ncbi:cytochrome C oxidase subunit IV family protein [Ferruginibacter albus]|uniref:cytochrome C oxidase subunit IV family protein n=1 Tax=Ferruginibacter albus TaxID=2875540 RepID=UPI001CC8248E|nr:cytochrome C oxidase subunit IV family protein [Ferruginibacter albus]UAY52177.1 cytochrome C oxidase subunit IV family protein [Ferruginibacter albus]
MSEVLASPEITFAHEPAKGTGRIWKIFWILSGITIIELALGFGLAKEWYGDPHAHATAILFVKGVICILSLAKAFYIVSVFMHLGDEIRNFIMTIVVPLSLFIWFIAAFLWDGNSWRNLRNEYKEKRPTTEQVAPAPEH